MGVGWSGVSNFAYTSSGEAFGVIATESSGPGVSVRGGPPSQEPLLTESGLFLLTEDGEVLLTE